MERDDILNQIDSEIARLRQARAILTAGVESGSGAHRGRRGTPTAGQAPKPSIKKRNLSPEARARIAAAVKRRWAAQKAGKK